MANDRGSGILVSFLWCITFWGFVTIKFVGTSLAGWSWWWVLVPIVPIFGLLVQRGGL